MIRDGETTITNVGKERKKERKRNKGMNVIDFKGGP